MLYSQKSHCITSAESGLIFESVNNMTRMRVQIYSHVYSYPAKQLHSQKQRSVNRKCNQTKLCARAHTHKTQMQKKP